jgi:nitronate monooxygenase
MTLPASLQGRLSLPLIGSPMFIISQPELVIAQCRAGIVGAFPSLNARPSGTFEAWLQQLGAELTGQDAPFAVNLIVHRTNARLEEDLALCVKYKVPIVITSLGAQEKVNEAIHSYGGIVLHDVINNVFARKAIEKGADGLKSANGSMGRWRCLARSRPAGRSRRRG